MGPVETSMLRYIERRLAEGSLSVLEKDILAAVVPADHPEYRDRPSYRHGLDRLLRRHVINAVRDPRGRTHYFIGSHASRELLAALGVSDGDGAA
jgi:hypothetical protein